MGVLVHVSSFADKIILHKGIVGDETALHDRNAESLNVGDIVMLFRPDGSEVGLSFVCYTEPSIKENDDFYTPYGFIDGIRSNCTKDGQFTDGWDVELKFKYGIVAHGTIVHKIVLIEKELSIINLKN